MLRRHWAAAVLAVAAISPCAFADGYRAGVASIKITPTEPMWLGGYASRTHASTGTLMDLWAKALVLEDARGTRLVIVTMDLLGLPANIANPVAEQLMRKHGLERRQIVLSSSHTHCGPVLRQSLIEIYGLEPEDGARIERYSRWVQERLLEVVGAAMDSLAPATLARACGTATFAVNRRENVEAKVVEGYQGKGPVDHDVPVLSISGPDGKLRAVLFGYACHNTTMDFYQWSGDYAGFAQLNVHAAHPGVTAMFFAGCGADQNPLPRRKIELCEKYGRQLADAVNAVLGGTMAPIQGDFAAAIRWVDLPFDKQPTREDLQRQLDDKQRAMRGRAKRLLAQLDRGEQLPKTYRYPVQAIRIGRDLDVVVLAGEVVVDYSLRLKRELGTANTWVMAYSNDVFAYIPSRRVLGEGRYEGETSMVTYGLPGVWSPAIEELVVNAVHDAVKEVRGSTSAPAR